MPEIEPQRALRPAATRSTVLLAVYVAIVGWLYYGEATGWPREGSWASLAYLVLCPGIAFQAFNLAYGRLMARPLTRRWLARLVTIPLGLALGFALALSADRLAMAGFEQAYAPLAAQVAANLADPCARGGKYFDSPSVAAYNRQAGRERPAADLKYNEKRFVLSFAGGSIDIDGSTIYYDSGTRAWSKFHNDRTDKSGDFARRTEGLAGCRLQAPAGAAK